MSPEPAGSFSTRPEATSWSEACGLTGQAANRRPWTTTVLDRQDTRENVLDANEAIVRKHFGLASLPAASADLAETAVHLA
jgi:hypothetical protein